MNFFGQRLPILACLLLMSALASTSTSASAQFRQPSAQLTTTVVEEIFRAGDTATLKLEVQLPEDIHVQSDKPRDPYVIPTLLTLALPEGLTMGGITYPESTDFQLVGWEEPLLVFEHEFTIEVLLNLDVSLPTGEIVIPGSFLYQACDDQVCFAPATEAYEFAVTIIQLSEKTGLPSNLLAKDSLTVFDSSSIEVGELSSGDS